MSQINYPTNLLYIGEVFCCSETAAKASSRLQSDRDRDRADMSLCTAFALSDSVYGADGGCRSCGWVAVTQLGQEQDSLKEDVSSGGAVAPRGKGGNGVSGTWGDESKTSPQSLTNFSEPHLVSPKARLGEGRASSLCQRVPLHTVVTADTSSVAFSDSSPSKGKPLDNPSVSFAAFPSCGTRNSCRSFHRGLCPLLAIVFPTLAEKTICHPRRGNRLAVDYQIGLQKTHMQLTAAPISASCFRHRRRSLCNPSCGSQTACRAVRLLGRFDRCANFCSLFPPPAAVAEIALCTREAIRRCICAASVL